MRTGFSISLLAVGAILAFAVSASVAGLDLHVVGWVLMAAGALGLVLTITVFAPRRRRTLVETRAVPAGAPLPGRPCRRARAFDSVFK